MDNTFEILARFLDRYGEDVEGRALEEMPPEITAKLRAFAGGGLPAAERGALARLLKENPRWISVLADEVKAGRAGGGA